jgi:hypothetical protein
MLQSLKTITGKAVTYDERPKRSLFSDVCRTLQLLSLELAQKIQISLFDCPTLETKGKSGIEANSSTSLL